MCSGIDATTVLTQLSTSARYDECRMEGLFESTRLVIGGAIGVGSDVELRA